MCSEHYVIYTWAHKFGNVDGVIDHLFSYFLVACMCTI